MEFCELHCFRKIRDQNIYMVFLILPEAIHIYAQHENVYIIGYKIQTTAGVTALAKL